MNDSLVDVLNKNDTVKDVTIVDSDSKKDKDGTDIYMKKGSFFIDDTVFTFTEMHSKKINVSQVQLNFRFTLDKNTSRDILLSISNELNTKIPCIKSHLKNIEKKVAYFTFSYEIPFNDGTDIRNMINRSLDFLQVAPEITSDLLNKKGVKHKSISRS